MKFATILLTTALLTSLFPISAFGADPQPDKKPRKGARIMINQDELVIPEFEINMQDLEQAMEEMALQLEKLDGLHIDIPEIEIPDVDIEMPDIEPLHIEIPPVPHLDIDIPEFRGHFYCISETSSLYNDLSENEQLRLQALRSLARQEVDIAIPALKKVIEHDSSAALRYDALHQLGRFQEDERVVAILEKAAREDRILEVRKLAIRLLGKSKDPRAVRVLEDLMDE